MGRIESIRLSPVPRESALVDVSWSRREPELLELLSSGRPPAFAIDSRERIVFWNSGAAALLDKRAEDVMGRHCFDVLCGRDVWGNRFCSPACPLVGMARQDEPVSAFEVRTARGYNGESKPITLNVTLIRIPGPRPDLFTLVHILQEIDEDARLSRALAATGKVMPAIDAATPEVLGAPSAGVVPASNAAGPAVLTPREREILQWMAGGLQNKEIAQRLSLSLATVRNHIHNTLEKLGVHSKLEAVSLAFRNGWVERPRSQG
jgi:DNA-binding CsgD family transcriptional regulator